MRRHGRSWLGILGLGLLAATAGCSDGAGRGADAKTPFGPGRLGTTKAGLQRAAGCEDLLTKIQDDAIAKVDLAIHQFKQNRSTDVAGPPFRDGGTSAPTPGFVSEPSAPNAGGGSEFGGTGGLGQGGGVPTGGSRDDSAADEPVGASETNTQVKGVDEADFVKLVDSGKGMFLLHGNTLRKLTTFPAESLSLEAASLKIEGQPSELFVTADGKAVVFSTVGGYATVPGRSGGGVDIAGPAIDCGPGFCGGGYGGAGTTKITVADVSGDTPTTLRELYYEGSYISSRRYGDLVRVVLQAQTGYGNLFYPEVDSYDSFGRPYSDARVEGQLAQWRERTVEDIRSTRLSDWLPLVKEAKDGVLTDVQPVCDSFFIPQPGLSASGLTHVLTLDVSSAASKVGGVTVLGDTSTVYSSLDRLVLAQPDYRWQSSRDFGVIDEQRTSLHVFSLAEGDTGYLASGWVPGQLPPYNPQFGIDVRDDHTLRIVTSGRSRTNPDAEPGSSEFWQQTVENRLFTLGEQGKELKVLGQSENLGHYEIGETVHSARFVGDRAYVVTFRQTDPLIALDVANASAPAVLGEIEIPGFSQYMHPLDQNHLITFGQSGTRGLQLQLFDVTDPATAIPQPKTLDLGNGGWSEASNNHKAFTYYAPKGLIALPLSGSSYDSNGYYRAEAGLQIIKVDAQQGFTALGSIDHLASYEQQGCYVCEAFGCRQVCSAPVEVRRGAFVETTDATYVYGISYAAVTVSDLTDLATPLKTATLPTPSHDSSSWYGSEQPTPTWQDAGSPAPEPGDPASPADAPRDAGAAMP